MSYYNNTDRSEYTQVFPSITLNDPSNPEKYQQTSSYRSNPDQFGYPSPPPHPVDHRPVTNNDMSTFGDTTAPLVTKLDSCDYSYIMPIEGVVDLIPPTPFNTPTTVGRRWLADAPPVGVTYNEATFRQDYKKENLPRCCPDMLTSSIGLVSLVLFILAIKNIDNELKFPFFIWGGITLFFYWLFHFFCTYQFCGVFGRLWFDAVTDKAQPMDQAMLSKPYNSTIYRRAAYTPTTNIIRSIAHVANDIPSLQFHVRCSHQTGNGKSSRTVVTFENSFFIPILHAKFIGRSADEFLAYLDAHAEGDTIVSYRPRLHLHEEQKDYIAKLKNIIYETNAHRDASCVVSLRVKSYSDSTSGSINPDDAYIIHTNVETNDHTASNVSNINTINDMMFSDDVSYEYMVPDVDTSDDGEEKAAKLLDNNLYDPQRKFMRLVDSHENGDHNRTYHQRKMVPVVENVTMRTVTSLGLHLDYFTDGTHSNAFLRFITHPVVWWFGTVFFFASAMYILFHRRFSHLIYHADFYAVLPEIAEFSAAYTSNPDLFLVPPDDKVQRRLVYGKSDQ